MERRRTQLGRYGIIGELNDAEVAAGLRIAEVWHRYEAAMGGRRSVRSPTRWGEVETLARNPRSRMRVAEGRGARSRQ
jgi:hypothetical protein